MPLKLKTKPNLKFLKEFLQKVLKMYQAEILKETYSESESLDCFHIYVHLWNVANLNWFVHVHEKKEEKKKKN